MGDGNSSCDHVTLVSGLGSQSKPDTEPEPGCLVTDGQTSSTRYVVQSHLDTAATSSSLVSRDSPTSSARSRLQTDPDTCSVSSSVFRDSPTFTGRSIVQSDPDTASSTVSSTLVQYGKTSGEGTIPIPDSSGTKVLHLMADRQHSTNVCQDADSPQFLLGSERSMRQTVSHVGRNNGSQCTSPENSPSAAERCKYRDSCSCEQRLLNDLSGPSCTLEVRKLETEDFIHKQSGISDRPGSSTVKAIRECSEDHTDTVRGNVVKDDPKAGVSSPSPLRGQDLADREHWLTLSCHSNQRERLLCTSNEPRHLSPGTSPPKCPRRSYFLSPTRLGNRETVHSSLTSPESKHCKRNSDTGTHNIQTECILCSTTKLNSGTNPLNNSDTGSRNTVKECPTASTTTNQQSNTDRKHLHSGSNPSKLMKDQGASILQSDSVNHSGSGQTWPSRKDVVLYRGQLSRPDLCGERRQRADSDSVVNRSNSRTGVHLTPPTPRSHRRPHSQEPVSVTENEGSSSPVCGSPLFSQNSLGDQEVALILNKLGYVEEEKQYVVGVNVRGASVDKLTALAVDCIDADGELCQKEAFLRVLFLMHQWFCTSELLTDKFLDLYKSCDNQICCAVALCKHHLSCTDCAKRQYKARICYTVRYWIQTFPMHFDCNRRLSQAVHRLQEQIWLEDPKSDLASLIDISKVPSYEWMRNISVRNPNKVHSTSKKVSLVFNNIKPAELAEQLTFLEFKAFRRITFMDLKNYAVSGSLKENPKLERSISLFNGLSQWVQCMVLCKTTPQQRANVILKFINVAKRLRELQNFNTLMAVVGGLTHSSLARLNKTHTCINQDYHKVLMEMTELLSSSNNFSSYRRALQHTHGFRIPILGVHLKDLILLNTALPDKLHTNLVNFRKMAQLSNTFKELMLVQNSTVPVEGNMDLVNMIKLSLDLHYTEDDIYELSLAREPRSSLSAPSTPTKPVVFAEWIAGVSPPDPETINKHVHDMVEAVFKNYDHDRDGFISHEEFEAIAGNFPFIDSFCVLDADKDGMISKAEMKTYFNRANCHALRKCFKHNFHEITYFKPTFCIHCTGLLWGLIKQGWKCKDCGINAHKHCKDLVVMECRSKAHAAVHGRSNSVPATFNGASGSHDVTLARKRKMSARHKRSRQAASTQTDESGALSSTNSPRLSGSMGEDGATSNNSLRLSGSTGDEDSECMAQGSTSQAGSQMSGGPTDFYEEQSTLYERLVKAEEVRESLQREKEALVERVEKQNVQIGSLHRQIGLIRQHTISFILDQMDTLNIQRDTQV